MLKFLVLLRRSAWRTFQHNGFAIAKAAAYSGILTLFPAFLVLASILEASDTTPQFFVQISYAIGKVLPKGTSGTVLAYFDLRNHKPTHLIFSASLVMLTAASGVIVSLMDGFRRAYGIQTNPWGFSGHGDVVWRHSGLRLVRYPLCKLQRHLWLAGSRHRPAGVVIPRLYCCPDRRGVQRANLPKTRDGIEMCFSEILSSRRTVG